MSSYSQLLRDPRWQRKRLEILNRDNWCCQGCLDTKGTLNVHHLFYVKGRAPWQYLDSAFTTLCNECHIHYEDFDAPPQAVYIQDWEWLIDAAKDTTTNIEELGLALEGLGDHGLDSAKFMAHAVAALGTPNHPRP